MQLKPLTVLATISLVLTSVSSSVAATWRSQSSQTLIPQLDTICWGNDTIDSVQTIFENRLYKGYLAFDYVKTKGCVPGDNLVGNFTLYNGDNRCSGAINVTWRRGNNAYVQWEIDDPRCPVNTQYWEINTYPVVEKDTPVTSPAGTATVFAPPSNVRATPNGEIICSVRSVTNINLYGSVNGWYKTDVCGSMGYIHNSQINF
ncbi:conserved exported hypothetical protein [Hyella patelloides LEGE 07179]|uniref:SH3b domain-containing protein n=1 Tax=Hyella patelloides LEGE 07179 TaxID=945734 RepID=A0A563VVF1_9CYAN|nr:hypothetical protein [Hyella patelloides]VEP15412.1 conserved exported hypothetical protein [Hyella patelloides LEGE 07179]